MAGKEGEQRPQCLNCPVCLESFKIPTLLRCGHTFCKECLQEYDEKRRDLDYLECPVCMKRTKLDENRIAGLSPNFSLLGLQEELHRRVDKSSSQHLCAVHKTECKNIFCEVCKKFISIACFIESHQNHKIVKKEDLEENLRKKKTSLLEESKLRKTQADQFVKNAECHKQSVDCHLSKLERSIKDAFARKITALQENENKLLQEVNSIREDSHKQLESCIVQQKVLIENIESSMVMLTCNTTADVTDDILVEHHLHCIDLEKSLKKSSDEESLPLQLQAVLNAQFHPQDSKFLDLGHIEMGEAKVTRRDTQPVMVVESGKAQETRDSQPVVGVKSGKAQKTRDPQPVVGVESEKAQELEENGEAIDIPPVVRSGSMTIVKKINLPDNLFGMATLSQDSVVVGYGGNRKGSDSFSLTGQQKQHLPSDVGNIWGIACLRNGRTIVSRDNTCQMYDAEGVPLAGVQYTAKESSRYLRLCADRNDNVFAVSGSSCIYIFRGVNHKPDRVFLQDFKPLQICVASTGVMIANTGVAPSTVSVFDQKGCQGSLLESKDYTEYMFAAVDSLDRVLIARQACASPVFRLTRYVLHGTTLVEESTFTKIRLPHKINRWGVWCYLASLTPSMLAFANGTHLYFIEIC